MSFIRTSEVEAESWHLQLSNKIRGNSWVLTLAVKQLSYNKSWVLAPTAKQRD
jgi:hypothetical protein